MKHDYHSSLTTPVETKPRQRVQLGDSLAFVADLGKGLPKEFAACDILYAEVAWERTYNRFVERAGRGCTYEEYLRSIAAVASEAAQPCVLVCGKRALRGLPEPIDAVPVNLNTGGRFIAEAVVVSYRCKVPDVRERHRNWTNMDTENLLHALTEKHNRIGDPCCGYGNTGRVFAEHGRQFVLSDINPMCIGYIAEHAKTWVPRVVA